MLGQLQTVQRVCCRGIRWQKPAAPCLPAAFLFIISAFCLITAHLQPGWRCMLPSTRGGDRLYKPLFGLQGEKKSSWKKGAFIIFEPITIMVSANPTIVQVFQNRDTSAPLQLKKRQPSGSFIRNAPAFFFVFFTISNFTWSRFSNLLSFFNKIISRYLTMLTPLNILCLLIGGPDQ